MHDKRVSDVSMFVYFCVYTVIHTLMGALGIVINLGVSVYKAFTSFHSRSHYSLIF